MKIKQDQWYSPKEVASIMQVSDFTIRKYLNEGILKKRQAYFKGRIFILGSDVLQFLNQESW